MTTRADVERQYLTWNFAGAGSDRLTAGNWKFRKTVLYYQDGPYKRVVMDTKNMPIMFVRDNTYDVITQPKELQTKHGLVYRTWWLPTIGVLSRFDDDMLSTAELHERQKYLMTAELRAVIEEHVAPASAADLDAKMGSQIIARVDKMYARYFNYGLIFGLKWGEMPGMYKGEIREAIASKVKRYHDPKAVAQRERNYARKIAKRAFGL